MYIIHNYNVIIMFIIMYIIYNINMYISLNSIDILIMSSCQYRYFFLCISVFLIDLKKSTDK